MTIASLGREDISGEFFNALESSLAPWVAEVSKLVTGTQRVQEAPLVETETAEMREVPTFPGQPNEYPDGGTGMGRHVAGFREFAVLVEHKKYEGSFGVDADEWRRDKTGQIALRARELALRSNAHWARLLTALLANGETGLGYYDTANAPSSGEPFFYNDHLSRSGEGLDNMSGDGIHQSNLIERAIAVPSAPTPADFHDAVFAGIGAILGFVSHNLVIESEFLNRFVVCIPQSMIRVAGQAFDMPALMRNAGRTTDVVASLTFGTARFVPLPLPWTDRFAVLRADSSMAFVRSVESFSVSQLGADSEAAFNDGRVKFGVEASRAAQYGKWEHAAMVKFIST